MMKRRVLLLMIWLPVALLAGGSSHGCVVAACGETAGFDNNNPADLPEIRKGIDWMAQGNCNAPSTSTGCWNASGKVKYGCFGLDSNLLRWGESANDLLASAIDAIVRGDKYLALGKISLAFCHDPNFRDMVERDKKLVYDYVRTNYVAGWDNTTGLGIHSQAFKVGQAYNDNPSNRDHGLDGCAGNDSMSRVEVPEGLYVRVCEHGSGSDSMERGCRTLAAGIHLLPDIEFNDLVSYVCAGNTNKPQCREP